MKVENHQADYQSVISCFEAGRYPEMRQAAQALVNVSPQHERGWHMLGLACLFLGDAKAGLAALLRASELQPSNAEVWDHLGTAYIFLGRPGEASPAFERSTALDAGRAETWVNLGKNECDLGRPEKAIEAYRTAIRLNPKLIEAYNNLSGVLIQVARPAEALAVTDAALEISQELVWIHIHRGNALKAMGRLEEAVAAYRRATEVDRSRPQAWNNLGNALQDLGDNEAAIEACEFALMLSPHDPEIRNNLGALYADAKRLAEAEEMLRVATERRPNYVEAWLNLAKVLPAGTEEKVAAYRKALEFRPDLEHALSSVAFNLNYLPVTPQALFDAAVSYGTTLARRVTPRSAWPNRPDPTRSLRVGLVSADLCVHPVAYFLEGTLMCARTAGIEWVAYSGTEKEDGTTTTLKSYCSLWRDIRGMSDSEVCDQIANDGIDILIDLSGHTEGHRLPVLAAKPAPVQVTWLGYVGTTGVGAIDYILGDSFVLPEDAPCWTVEKPWRLPECYMSFTRPPFDLAITEPPALKNGFVTFGCFNNLAKVNDSVLEVWARVLAAVPGSRLVLRAKQLGDQMVRDRLVAHLAGLGVSVDRVQLSGSLPSRELAMAEYAKVDIALDPFPYTGATTSVEALWMGVPVLTMKGDRFIARVGESLNANMGLRHLIAEDADDYVSRAARLAADPAALSTLRQTLRDRGAASPLGNPVWFANQLTAALRGMWKEWCRGEGR
jgi:protein O-GlcNAc transferase